MAESTSVDGADLAIFAAVVLVRLILPLLIPRYPLPAVVACLCVDGIDQTIFQQFTDLPLEGYQSYDKALDIYYLTIAYLAAIRNWTNHKAYQIAAFLLMYRLVGVAIFEGTGAEYRWLLLIFPNTFEYFFIAYEAIRTRWNPLRMNARFLYLMAAGIWIFIKLPQEWWIHIAQLDTTDLIRANPWIGVLMAVAVIGILAVAWFVVLPRAPEYDHGFTFKADPLPEGIDEDHERRELVSQGSVFNHVLAQKVFVLGLMTFIFGTIFPSVDLSLGQSVFWVGAIVILDTAISLAMARRARGVNNSALALVLTMAVNLAFLVVAGRFLGLFETSDGDAIALEDISWGAPIFFVFLISLVVVLFDRFRPVHDYRFHSDSEAVVGR